MYYPQNAQFYCCFFPMLHIERVKSESQDFMKFSNRFHFGQICLCVCVCVKLNKLSKVCIMYLKGQRVHV